MKAQTFTPNAFTFSYCIRLRYVWDYYSGSVFLELTRNGFGFIEGIRCMSLKLIIRQSCREFSYIWWYEGQVKASQPRNEEGLLNIHFPLLQLLHFIQNVFQPKIFSDLVKEVTKRQSNLANILFVLEILPFFPLLKHVWGLEYSYDRTQFFFCFPR